MEDDLLATAVRDAVRCCRAAGASKEDAEDFAHDAVVQLLALIAKQGRVTDPRGWLTTTARRRMIDAARREQRERLRLTRVAARDGDVPDPAELVSNQALALWLVADGLTQLPDVTRQVCDATAAGLNPRQTAGLLGLSVRSVESHLTRARRWLRRLAAIAAVPTLEYVRRLVRDLAAAPMLPATLVAPLTLTAAVTLIAVTPTIPPISAPPTPVETQSGPANKPVHETPDALARPSERNVPTPAALPTATTAWPARSSPDNPSSTSQDHTTHPEEPTERVASGMITASAPVAAQAENTTGPRGTGKAARQHKGSRPISQAGPADRRKENPGALSPGRTGLLPPQAERHDSTARREGGPNGSRGRKPSSGDRPGRDDRQPAPAGGNDRKAKPGPAR
ncbi:sigma-70 family RNA polymerase sigma factor [Streptomyces lavendofoliae]|uniref:sigma-70 family RNA polymerase sigma factor n=1 Tax=Streptomyces lavendofoliae TaxID=67314 RepID=UPI003D90FA5E